MSRSRPSAPLVSIITPVYNGARYLEDLLRSVRRQTYPNIEHIVIDDGSTDGGATVAILASHPEVKWWTRANRGQYATLNEGFAAAQGEIVTTISADDFYATDRAVAEVVERFADPKCDVAYGLTLHVDAVGNALPIQPYQSYPLWTLPYNPFISHCSLFVRAAAVRSLSLSFNESYRYVGDADWMIRLYRAGLRHVRIPHVLAAYRQHEDQATSQMGRDSASMSRKQREMELLAREHAPSAALRRAVAAYIACRRRLRVAKYAVRTGGARGALSAFRDWRTRTSAS